MDLYLLSINLHAYIFKHTVLALSTYLPLICFDNVCKKYPSCDFVSASLLWCSVMKKRMSVENENVMHNSLVDFSKKRSVVLCGCGFPQFEDNFIGLKCQLNMILHRYVGVFYSEAPLLNIKEAEAVADPLLEKFYEAGKEFRDRLWLSEKTIQDLEAPMIPMEKYVSYVNS